MNIKRICVSIQIDGLIGIYGIDFIQGVGGNLKTILNDDIERKQSFKTRIFTHMLNNIKKQVYF